jgi:hypothetical protein
MHLKRRHTETPLPEEYTRVTNPERLLPLHDLAVESMLLLRDAYDVTASSTFELIPGVMRPFEYARPPISLTPRSPTEAPVSIAFTTFPGLTLRCGRFFHEPFPVCGCDACAASFEREAERLQGILHSVVTGDFREEIEIPLLGTAHVSWSVGTANGPHGSSSSRSALPRETARKLSAKSTRIDWSRWSKRTGDEVNRRVHSNTR